ncbi:MAG TPA: TonB-dependent receptor, partial [Sphingomonas sp.]
MINARARLLASTLLVSAAVAAAPVHAQIAPQEGAATTVDPNAAITPQGDTPGATTATGDIVVTGTLLRNPNLISSSPVNVIGDAEIIKRAPNTAEELLRALPGVTPGIGSQVNNGANGTNSVDLRGLGSQRNLVLLDGNRIVPSLAGGTVDLNVIPLALIQRVDVLTGGASTTYGADAVSGVVNFITRTDFSGVDARASYRLTERGDGGSLRADLTLGSNFADDRGNAVLNFSYTEIDPIYQTRDFSLFGIDSRAIASGGRATGASATSVPTAVAFNSGAFSQVSPDGTALVPQYEGFNFNPYNIFQTPIDRKAAYAATNYQVSDSIEVYARGLFSQTTVNQIIAPSGIFGNELNIPANNPYLNAGIRNQICADNFGVQSAAAADVSANPIVRAAFAADAARYAPGACAAQTGTSLFVAPTVNDAGVVTNPGQAGTGLLLPGVYRRLVELGPRISNFENNLYDARGGARFKLSETINFDASAAYGRSEQSQTQSGYTLNSRIQQAVNATNATSCTVVTGGCVPLNLFGAAGSITPDQVAFIAGESTIRINTELSQFRGVLSGDFGTVFPGAAEPIGFAAGGEYRKYTYERRPDAFAQNPVELGGAGGAVLPFAGGYNVKEAFGELIAPIASDRAFFDELTLEAGIRYSDYKLTTGGGYNTLTYKGGGTWQPVDGFRLRGNYQRAVRAPNIAELFTPVVTALTNLSTDPCALAAPVGNAALAAVCRAQGAPASSIGTIPNPVAGQPQSTGGGNVNLRPEKANTITGGFVVTPRDLIPGLSLSLDYYNIKIKDAITAPTPGDAIAACFTRDLSVSNPACTNIRRNPVNGGLSGPANTTFGLPLAQSNTGQLKTDGFDLTANYNRRFGEVGVNLNFVGNYSRSLKFQSQPGSVNRECAGYFSANCAPALGQIQPKISWQQRSTLSFGAADVSLLWRHIGKVEYEGQADDFIARGFTAANRNLFVGTITNGAGVNSPVAGQAVNFNR